MRLRTQTCRRRLRCRGQLSARSVHPPRPRQPPSSASSPGDPRFAPSATPSEPSRPPSPFNARSELVKEKVSFMRLIPSNRCLVAVEDHRYNGK
ncbi:uncharacterized protein M6B38_149195 [Iris pallida]|uniref:Uncharacterized protein n=1 Tax=Iris pallida TaxID=29817 RepID=A0AAX6F759_IRIPA|nr:uncharacterized protein M6B38_149195 [Iris pallida]